jgi:hypothetical protein
MERSPDDFQPKSRWEAAVAIVVRIVEYASAEKEKRNQKCCTFRILKR